jgi:AraC-like DNA-binding protein
MAKQDNSELIKRFKQFVYSHDLRLEQAAILLKMSPSGIYRMFNRESGTLHPRTAYKIKGILEETNAIPRK